jgi:hypothetical protein
MGQAASMMPFVRGRRKPVACAGVARPEPPGRRGLNLKPREKCSSGLLAGNFSDPSLAAVLFISRSDMF